MLRLRWLRPKRRMASVKRQHGKKTGGGFGELWNGGGTVVWEKNQWEGFRGGTGTVQPARFAPCQSESGATVSGMLLQRGAEAAVWSSGVAATSDRREGTPVMDNDGGVDMEGPHGRWVKSDKREDTLTVDSGGGHGSGEAARRNERREKKRRAEREKRRPWVFREGVIYMTPACSPLSSVAVACGGAELRAATTGDRRERPATRGKRSDGAGAEEEEPS